MSQNRLRRLRWAVRATLALGVAASVTANVLHAQPNPISQTIAAWPPLALLITVELVSRIPIYRKSLGAVRIIATSAIASIAAWISYGHMAEVVARYGETGTVPYLLPLSVDGLIVVASVSLVELADSRRDTVPGPASPEAYTAPAPTTAAPAGRLTESTTAVPDEPVPQLSGPVPTVIGGASPEPKAMPATISGRVDDPHADAGFDPGRDADEDDLDTNQGGSGRFGDLAPDLAPLLPAARAARDELVDEGRTISRDALARRMRRNGHTIRNNRVSELLAALRQQTPSANGSQPKTSV